MESRNAWLAELKAGDEVFIRTGYGYGSYSRHTIDKVTATQIVVGYGRFNREDGSMRGRSSYSSSCLVSITNEDAILSNLRCRVLQCGDRLQRLSGRLDAATCESILKTLTPLMETADGH